MSDTFSRRQFLLGAASAVPLLSLNGCSQPTSDQNSIVMGVTSRVTMLDPRKATDALSSRINRLLYRQLIDFNEAFEPVADLARWQQLSPTHYRFFLQQQPMFHHGKKLVAEDVAATYQSVLDKNTASPHRGSLKHIESVEAVDQRTVDFKLSKADALFVGRLVIGILPADLIAKNQPFQSQPIGCGPCQFVSMSEQRLVLTRADQVELHFVPVKDSTTRVLKLQKGELDLIQNDLPPELLNYCQQQPGLEVSAHKGTNFSYIGFNFEDPLLARPEMREAIAYGLDRQQIIQYLFSGKARLAGGLLTPEHWCGVPEIDGFAYDPQLAKQKLAEIKKIPGLVDSYLNQQGEIELSYKTSSDPTRIRLATIYQHQLKKIGIRLKIQSYDWGTFYNDIKQGRFQLYSLTWVGIKSPDIFQYVFDSNAIPPKGANRGRYRDQTADELIRKAGQSQSLIEQAQLYKQLQIHLQNTLAALPLWYEDHYLVRHQSISHYALYADGRFDGLLKATKA